MRKELRKRSRRSGSHQQIRRQRRKVARSKAHAMDEMYKDLKTPEGERKFSRIAKARDETAKISRRSHPQSTVQSGWKNWKRVSGVLCDRKRT